MKLSALHSCLCYDLYKGHLKNLFRLTAHAYGINSVQTHQLRLVTRKLIFQVGLIIQLEHILYILGDFISQKQANGGFTKLLRFLCFVITTYILATTCSARRQWYVYYIQAACILQGKVHSPPPTPPKIYK